MKIGTWVKVEILNCGALKAAARELGFSRVRFLGDNGKSGDSCISAWGYAPTGQQGGGELRYLMNNADGLFEEADPQGFAEAAGFLI